MNRGDIKIGNWTALFAGLGVILIFIGGLMLMLLMARDDPDRITPRSHVQPGGGR